GGPDHDGYGTGIPCRTITEAVQACSDMETTGQSDIAMAVAVEDRRRAERAVERAGRGFAAPARAATASRGNSANYGQASASHPHKMTPSVELD
ncbi:MAG: hypothetical protein L0H41_15445, partial [Microlunatus sp.]|nr:hypothetical protein [Microlunatus sp.]